MIAKSKRWQKTTLAAVTAALLGLYGSNSAALSLGRITVQSALGEPLRAEIDIPDINAGEVASLKVGVAQPEAFRAAGLEYNPAMARLQASLQKRPDGRAYLRLSSDSAINDPFVDMLLEASWATGRIVRDYTLLFDPPNLRRDTATAARVDAPMPTSRTVPAKSSPAGSNGTPDVRPPALRQAIRKTTARPDPDQPPHGASQITVKPGDTASKIALALKPSHVSLDQMLVALLRANPQAFVRDNVNRIKAGAIVNAPSEEQIQATPAIEATQLIIAQSKDFNSFRRDLAGSAPPTAVAAPERKVSGKLQTRVEDKKPVTTAPDKLTLSKGAMLGKTVEDQVAKQRSTKEAAARAAEISKNISDLGKLGATGAPTAAAAPVASALVAPVPINAPPANLTAASQSLPSSRPGASAAKPAASAVPGTPAVATAPQPESSLINDLIENPLAPAGALGLLALLAGFGFYRARQRKTAAQADSVFLESRLQPDSFFGASGGQSVDTSDGAATGSSMVYSPSQLDAVDDVDPVAEADVYLAYGRDMQAEEILKDALRTNPGRIAIHQKLLEIFAKRRDAKSFEGSATQLFRITNGQGPEWEHVCDLGLGIDPANAFYQPGGQPNNPDGSPSRPAPLEVSSSPEAAQDPLATQALTPEVGAATDLDFDLDFSLDDKPVSAIREATPSSAQASVESDAQVSSAAPLDLDFGLDTEASEPFEALPTTVKADPVNVSLPVPVTAQDPLTSNSEDFKQQATASFGATESGAPSVAQPTPTATPDLSMLQFDLGSLSLDLGEPVKTEDGAEPGEQEDPLVTKLALAQEFRAIGDDDGARALIEEVMTEATGDMKIMAQRALDNL